MRFLEKVPLCGVSCMEKHSTNQAASPLSPISLFLKQGLTVFAPADQELPVESRLAPNLQQSSCCSLPSINTRHHSRLNCTLYMSECHGERIRSPFACLFLWELFVERNLAMYGVPARHLLCTVYQLGICYAPVYQPGTCYVRCTSCLRPAVYGVLA